MCLTLVRGLEDTKDTIPVFLAVLTGAFAFYFAALLMIRGAASRLHPAWVIGIAVLIQMAPFRGQPVWDTDAYRYHWDGKLLAEGVNPYRFAPGDHRIAHLRGEWWQPIDYKWVKTIYPPVNQLLLAGTYFLDPTPRRTLLLAMLFHLLCLWPLLLLMRLRGVDSKWLAIYAWNPLLATEFAIGGHQDPISVFLLLAALYGIEKRRPMRASALMALSVMAKTHMVFVAPLVVWRTGPQGVLLFIALCIALTAPFAGAGSDLLSGSAAYLGQWENNSGLFAVLRAGLTALLDDADAGGVAARGICAVTIIALAVWLTFRRGDIALHAAIILACVLLLSPTFFPWYISWVLPFVCLLPNVTGVIATFLLLAPYLYIYDKPLGFLVRIPEIGLLYLCAAVELQLWRRRIAAAGRRRATSSCEDTPSEQ